MTEDFKPRWPRRLPAWRLAGFVLAVGCGVLLIRIDVRRGRPLEQFHFREYVKSETFGDFSLRTVPDKPHEPGRAFPVVFAGDLLASDDLLADSGQPVSVRVMRLDPKAFHAWIRKTIYGGESLARWLIVPLVGFGVLVIGFTAAGAYLDREHNREARHGRRLRGPGIVSRWKFVSDW